LSLEISSVATEQNEGFVRFSASLAAFGVQPTVRGTGEVFHGYAWRFKQLVSAVRASTADLILFADAYDTLCLANPLLALPTFQSFGHPIVFSFEPQRQPEPYLALNAGLMMANRSAFLDVFTDAVLEQLFPDHFNDQLQLQAMLSWQPDLFRLDVNSHLFFTSLSGAPIPPSRTPIFVHAPYGGPLPNFVTTDVRRWPTEGSSL
jgi:hypothetical protein